MLWWNDYFGWMFHCGMWGLWAILITTLLPMKCGIEFQKDNLPKQRKDWALVKTSFNYCSSGSGQNSVIPVVCHVPE